MPNIDLIHICHRQAPRHIAYQPLCSFTIIRLSAAERAQDLYWLIYHVVAPPT
jgi:hypothetical protein